MKHVSRNMLHSRPLCLIVLREEILCNCRHCCCVFCWFKWKDYNKLCKIYFPNVRWATNMLHAIYLLNMFYTVCFIGMHPSLEPFHTYRLSYDIFTFMTLTIMRAFTLSVVWYKCCRTSFPSCQYRFMMHIAYNV